MEFDASIEAKLRAAVDRELPRARKELEELVRIPGIAFPGYDRAEVDRSADAVAELLRGAGLTVDVARAGDGFPAVIGRRAAPAGAPTVLLYAHHDVQPAGDLALWDTDPFEPVERDGRLYGRGAADDKAGLLAHLVALRALGDDVPVGVVVFVEGEEESGSATLAELLREHRAAVAADVVVIADSMNLDVGTPALTTSLRGIVNCFVEVRTLDAAVHSGMFGGAVPDALTVLVRLLATLHDERGDAAIEGLVTALSAAPDMPVARLRAEAGMLDGVSLIGTGSLVERLWTRPAVSVLGIDAPTVRDSANALVPAARARISVRLAPGDDPERAYAAIRDHLVTRTPWGAVVSVELEGSGAPCVLDSTGPAHDVVRAALRTAWDGAEPVEIGGGGSIPGVATLRDEMPAAAIAITGVEDPETRAHAPNESLHLGEFARACLAEALLLTGLGALAAAGPGAAAAQPTSARTASAGSTAVS